MEDLLPEDFEELPDSEAKRNAENYAHRLKMLIDQMDTGPESEFKNFHADANETWYKMNAQVGRAYHEHKASRRENLRFCLNFGLSIIAICISVYAVVQGT